MRQQRGGRAHALERGAHALAAAAPTRSPLLPPPPPLNTHTHPPLAQKYLPHVLQMLQGAMALSVQQQAASASDEDLADYNNMLRHGILEAWAGAFNGLSRDKADQYLKPYAPQVLEFAEAIYVDHSNQDDCKWRALGVTGCAAATPIRQPHHSSPSPTPSGAHSRVEGCRGAAGRRCVAGRRGPAVHAKTVCGAVPAPGGAGAQHAGCGQLGAPDDRQGSARRMTPAWQLLEWQA